MFRIEAKTKEQAAETCYLILTMRFGKNPELNLYNGKMMKNPMPNAVFEELPEATTFDESIDYDTFKEAFMECEAATGVPDYKGGRYAFGWVPELNGIVVNFVGNPRHEREFEDAFNAHLKAA